MSEQPIDNKAHIRNELDLANATWVSAKPEDVDLDDYAEYAFVAHTDGLTYTALRHASAPDGHVLIFDPSEWKAFILGVRDGQFLFPSAP